MTALPNEADVLIIGAGPAGIFTALSLCEQGYSGSVVMVEQGLPLEKRSCPKTKTKECVQCNPCRITTGFSGAGAFSDGKLSLSREVGGDLPELIGEQRAQEMISRVDDVYLRYGADEHIEGLDSPEGIKEIRRKAIQAGLKLVDCPIRHLGTEKAQEIYLSIQHYLINQGVDIYFSTKCTDLIVEDESCKGALLRPLLGTKEDETACRAKRTIVATGRRGADWLAQMCVDHEIEHMPGTVDVGVRVELRNEIMEHVNNVLYESKLIGYPNPFRDKVRTFCQNPGGFVSQENYDDNLAVVNGHSYKERKSNNTNLAILCSHNFTEPFDQPITYAKHISELANMLGDGHILVQRFGDILDGKRTWAKELSRSNVRPTLKDAVAGDITSALPYRTMTSIVEFMLAVDQAIPGFASGETLLYAPEVKFYSNLVKMNEDFDTNIEGLHCLGDSSGWTRGLMMASVMGYIMGERLANID